MSRIHLLPEILASQVAAGEVIERPASVVKELVENSIDAAAKQIEVMIRRGGASLIRVLDDGVGMDHDDALLSLERHATSKIRSAEDLAAISTLGFRGEALPSIASVSRFRLTTHERDAAAGTEIVVNGGRIEHVRAGGEAPGTQIEVRSLFFNLPARRKFLRTETTESRHIEHQLFMQAIAHPEIGFVFVRDDQVALQLPAVTDLQQRIRDLHGAELVDKLLPVERESASHVHVSGWIGGAGISRSTRTQQFVFVNGRAIESPVVNAGLREGYHTALMKGQYPITFLFIALDPTAVDVNVHPAKREVRFRDPSSVREAVASAVQQSLAGGRESWQQTFAAPARSGGTTSRSSTSDVTGQEALVHPFDVKAQSPVPQFPAFAHTDIAQFAAAISARPSVIPSEVEGPRDLTPTSPTISTPAKQSQFQILGVLNRLYVLMQNENGLVLVDQHAAHERVLFEEMRRRMEEQGVPSQRLLISQIFELAPRDAGWVEHNAKTLRKMGIGIEHFGGNSFRVESLPAFVRVNDATQFVREVIDELKSASKSTSPLRLGEDMIAKTVCRHAVKANDYLREPEIENLIRDLLACELPYCCPHGRPTMIQISYGELEKKFGRKV